MRELDDNQKAALCAAIRTSRYARKVVSLLRDLSEDLYRTDKTNPLTQLETTLEDELARVFTDLLKDVDIANPMEAEQSLRKVIDYVNEVEEIGFVVPVHPRKEFVERLYSWCAENINGQIFLDFTTNRLMESGLLMVYKGRYFEYSLENLLNEYLGNHELSKFFDNAVNVQGQEPAADIKKQVLES